MKKWLNWLLNKHFVIVIFIKYMKWKSTPQMLVVYLFSITLTTALCLAFTTLSVWQYLLMLIYVFIFQNFIFPFIDKTVGIMIEKFTPTKHSSNGSYFIQVSNCKDTNLHLVKETKKGCEYEQKQGIIGAAMWHKTEGELLIKQNNNINSLILVDAQETIAKSKLNL